MTPFSTGLSTVPLKPFNTKDSTLQDPLAPCKEAMCSCLLDFSFSFFFFLYPNRNVLIPCMSWRGWQWKSAGSSFCSWGNKSFWRGATTRMRGDDLVGQSPSCPQMPHEDGNEVVHSPALAHSGPTCPPAGSPRPWRVGEAGCVGLHCFKPTSMWAFTGRGRDTTSWLPLLTTELLVSLWSGCGVRAGEREGTKPQGTFLWPILKTVAENSHPVQDEHQGSFTHVTWALPIHCFFPSLRIVLCSAPAESHPKVRIWSHHRP